MQIANQKPDIPVPALRAPHFIRLHDKYVKEVDGEPMHVLDSDLLIKWLIRHKDNPELLGVIHDVNANAGIAVNLKNLMQGKTKASELLIDNREPSGGQIEFPMEAVAHLLVHHEKHENPHRRDLLIEFMAEVGLEPNLTRIRAELCPTCGK